MVTCPSPDGFIDLTQMMQHIGLYTGPPSNKLNSFLGANFTHLENFDWNGKLFKEQNLFEKGLTRLTSGRT